MKVDNLDLTPAVEQGILAAQRVFGLTPEQMIVFALESFLKDRGLLAQEERSLPPQRETRGLADRVFVRESKW